MWPFVSAIFPLAKCVQDLSVLNYVDSSSFYGQMIFHYIDILHFIYPLYQLMGTGVASTFGL